MMTSTAQQISVKLIDHHFARPGEQLPPVDEHKMLDYVVAANGTFARGRRPGLEVCMPVSFNLQPVRGLRAVESYAQWGYPRVPERLTKAILTISRSVCALSPDGVTLERGYKEALFHLSFDGHDHDRSPHVDCESGWHLEWPEQDAGVDYVRPTKTGAGTSTERAIIELHSHHNMRAEFSEEDNRDESQGFRVYTVIGTIFDRPRMRARVGLFGHFWEYSAAEFFELPDGLVDCVGL